MFETIWVQLVTAQAAEQQESSLSIFRIISETSGVVFGAICILGLLSLGSWYIIGYKWYYLDRARRQSDDFLDKFWQSKPLDSI
ncbi:MAG: hypothetical protein ABEN55_10350, partial [Bradymonadaceae bacterium]